MSAWQFHVLAFEGPDGYARAGGLASRVDGLSRALAALGHETHLWFVGDPDLAGSERRAGVHLHRWCQWISRYHRGGVYEGEEGKHADYTTSLPDYLTEHVLLPHLRAGGLGAIFAEEWHTADTVIEIDRRLRAAGRRETAALLWNANNVFGFDRIAWPELGRAAVVTTVSRMMRLRLEAFGLSPLVFANGLPPDAFVPPDRRAAAELRTRMAGRNVLVKVARWDPDKNWLYAIEATRRMRDEGLAPLLVARGGSESHEGDVRAAARAAGLRWIDRGTARHGVSAVTDAVRDLDGADVLCLRFPLDGESLRVLFRVADAVLANSRFEPYGLVGLEAMAVGGVACVGLTGEDYATPGRNALVMQTEDPRELTAVLRWLRDHPDEEAGVRRSARLTARQYAWPEVLERVVLPRLPLLRAPDLASEA